MQYKKFFGVLLVLMLAACAKPAPAPDLPRPRLVVETDGEEDDQASFKRMLLYTNDFDVVALIYGNSKWHTNGNGTTWMESSLDAYDQVDENLRLHDPDYPTADYLRSKQKVGNLVGCQPTGPENNTEGSDYLVSILLEDDPRPIWLTSWGGDDTIAQALWVIKTSYPEKVDAIMAKARMYIIVPSQSTCGTVPSDWIADNYPDLLIIADDVELAAVGYYNTRQVPDDLQYLFSNDWVSAHIKNNHGPLGALYTTYFDGEGDSPAFFGLMSPSQGLSNLAIPSYGGWGGRFVKQSHGASNNWWGDTPDDNDEQKPIWRWMEPMWMDWSARLDWTILPYDQANHAPVVRVVGDLDRTAAAGSKVTLSAAGSSDPDGDQLNYLWWQYYDADSASAQVTISNDTSRNNASFIVPDEPGKTIHIILEVTDDGSPALKSWQRVVFTIQ